MKKIFLLIVLQTMLALPMMVKGQTKRALVIGLGKQEDPNWSKINGDKDVPYVLKMLNKANYGQIITCVNEQATKAGIVSAFRALEQSCQTNDVVYVHYSGHGQQVRDRSNDENDALDESWIPYDAYLKPCEKDGGEKHLIDDEINMYLTNIRYKIGNGGKMLVVVDACHSGDGTRASDEIIRGVSDTFDVVKSWLMKPSGYSSVVFPNIEQWITLTACESNQVNIEMKKPKVGKLTYAIYKIGVEKQENNEHFFFKLSRFMNANSGTRPQRPTMTGETDKYNMTDILR